VFLDFAGAGALPSDAVSVSHKADNVLITITADGVRHALKLREWRLVLRLPGYSHGDGLADCSYGRTLARTALPPLQSLCTRKLTARVRVPARTASPSH